MRGGLVRGKEAAAEHGPGLPSALGGTDLDTDPCPGAPGPGDAGRVDAPGEGASYRLRHHADLIPEHTRSHATITPPPPPKRRGRPPKNGGAHHMHG